VKSSVACWCTRLILVGLTLPSAFAQASAGQAPDGWISLFNGKDLSGWYTFLGASGKNKDPKGIFKVEDGMIHIVDYPKPDGDSDDGYLGTNQEYQNVRIHAEYKWGPRRFSELKKNSGLLYLAVGPDTVYPTSLEFQIEESDVGDLWMVNGAAATAFLIAPTMPMFDDDMGTGTYIRSALGHSNRVLKSGDFEDRNGWNTVEVILNRNDATQLVNGRIINHARDIQQPDPNNPAHMIPLKSGKILLEAEDSSEIWFRNVRVKPIKPGEKP
jgi:hypothetical protein